MSRKNILKILKILNFTGIEPPERGVLKYFAKFIGKHLCQSLFFNKVAGLKPAT